MNCWVVFPSRKPAAECNAVLALWHAKGYKSAVFRDSGDDYVKATVCVDDDYDGYAKTQNRLIKFVMGLDPNAEWIVSAADDLEPDPNHTAQEIAAQCREYFGGTWGIMQATGDRWGADVKQPNCRPDRVAYADRVCGSPFIGREVCERLYGGEGPYWHGWHHMFCDEEIQCVAEMLGILWQRRDLTHFHNHWGRQKHRKMPEYLKKANARFAADRALFNQRKAAGFPGYDPLPASEGAVLQHG